MTAQGSSPTLDILDRAKAQIDNAWREFLNTGVIFRLLDYLGGLPAEELISHAIVRSIIHRQAKQLRLPVITAVEHRRFSGKRFIVVMVAREKRMEVAVAPMLLIGSDEPDAAVHVRLLATKWAITFNDEEGVKIFHDWVAGLPAPSSSFMRRAA